MKTPIAFLLTDTHLSPFNISLVEKLFQEGVDICKKKNIKTFIHLGDFFETRASLTYEVLNSATKIFELLNNSGISIHIIAGNHDRPYVGKNSYLSLFQSFFKNIHIYEEISKCEYSDIFNFIFLPNHDKCLEDKLKNVDFDSFLKGKKNILFAHHQFTEIPVEIQSKFDLILMGHLHDKEKISKKVLYIGSGYQQNFSEDSDKGFTILYDDLSLKQIKSNFKEFFVQKVDLNTFTEFEIKEFIKNFRNSNPDKFLRIVLEGINKDTIDLKEFCKSLDIEVISNVQNLATKSNEFYLSELSKDQIFKYFEEYSKLNNTSKDIEEILLNIFGGI